MAVPSSSILGLLDSAGLHGRNNISRHKTVEATHPFFFFLIIVLKSVSAIILAFVVLK